MSGKVVRIDASHIVSESTFHDAFAKAFGFPHWYGRNGDAWIDLMSWLDGDDRTAAFSVQAGETVTILIENAKPFRAKYRSLYDDLIECAAFVNMRRLESGDPPYLCLAFGD